MTGLGEPSEAGIEPGPWVARNGLREGTDTWPGRTDARGRALAAHLRTGRDGTRFMRHAGRTTRPTAWGTMMRDVPISDEMAYLIISACRHRARQLDELIDTDALAVDDVPRALHTQQEYLSVAEHLARLFRYS